MRSVGLTVLGLLGARGLAGCRRGAGAASPQDVRAADASSAAPIAGDASGGDASGEVPADVAADPGPASPDDTSAVPEAPAAVGGTAWERVRGCWYGLLAWQAREDRNTVPHEQREAERDRRKAEHRAASDELTAAGELRPAIAERLVAAFDEAAFHVWRSSAGMTCYRMTVAGSRLGEGRGAILERLATLKELLEQGVVSEEAASDARTTFERELLLFDRVAELQAAPVEGRWQVEQRLIEQIEGGEVPPDDDDREAARVLVDLLLARPAR